jgi:hypothetical protein
MSLPLEKHYRFDSALGPNSFLSPKDHDKRNKDLWSDLRVGAEVVDIGLEAGYAIRAEGSFNLTNCEPILEST